MSAKRARPHQSQQIEPTWSTDRLFPFGSGCSGTSTSADVLLLEPLFDEHLSSSSSSSSSCHSLDGCHHPSEVRHQASTGMFFAASSSSEGSWIARWDEEHIKAKTHELEALANERLKCASQTEALTNLIRSVQMPLSLDNREVLEHQVRRTIEFVERCFYEAGKMLGDSFLQPQDVRRALQLQQDLLILNEQLVLYRDEVTYLQTVSIDQPACLPSVGRFVLIESPFPKAIKKQAKAAVRNEKSVTVKLLTLARASVPPNPEVVHPEVVEVSAIQVLVSDDRADPQPIDQVSTKLDMKTLEGRFDSLKFNKATRCATARLIFRADVLASYSCGLDATVQITRSSVASYQLSSPGRASEGKLLKYSIFKERPDRAVNIHCLTNHLQVHFWRGTRQDIGDERLSRPFSLCDLRYLSSLSLEGGCCFPRLDRIGEAEFDSFWSWFGQVFRLVRHTPVLNELWRDGLVSLMSRDEAENHLRRFPAGHFLLRFSESMPKGVVISSHHGSSHMEHWLVDTSQHMEKLFAILQADSRFEHVLVVIKDYFSARRFTVESKNERFGSHFRPDTTVEKASKRYRRA